MYLKCMIKVEVFQTRGFKKVKLSIISNACKKKVTRWSIFKRMQKKSDALKYF